MDRIGKARLKALRLSYRAYLRSRHWKAFRRSFFALSALQRACYACGAKRRLQLHHLTYERLGCERLSDVVPLCGSCHQTLHLLQKHRRKRYVTRGAVRVALGVR